eukprot:UN00376
MSCAACSPDSPRLRCRRRQQINMDQQTTHKVYGTIKTDETSTQNQPNIICNNIRKRHREISNYDSKVKWFWLLF